MTASVTSIRTSSKSSGSRSPIAAPAARAGSNGGNGKRKELTKSKSARALSATTKGTMKSFRNLMGLVGGDNSASGHRSLRQFNHYELASDSEGDFDSHPYKDDSSSSGPSVADGKDKDHPANHSEVNKEQEHGGKDSISKDNSEESDMYQSPTSVTENIESVDYPNTKGLPIKSQEPSNKASSSSCQVHKSSSMQDMVTNRFARRNKARASFRKSQSFGSLRVDNASTTSRTTPKQKQEAAGKSMNSRMAGLANKGAAPRERRRQGGPQQLRKADSLKSLTVSEMSPGPVQAATDNSSTGSGSAGSGRLSISSRPPRERRGPGMSKRKSKSLRSLNVSDFMAPALSNSSPRSKDYRITALNHHRSPREQQRVDRSIRKSKSMRGLGMTNLSNPPPKEQSSHNSRRNIRSLDNTTDSPREPRDNNNRSVRKSHSVRGLNMTDLPDPSSSSLEKSRRSKRSSHRSSHTANSPWDVKRDNPSILKSNAMRGLRTLDRSDSGTGQSSRRSRKSSDTTDSPKDEKGNRSIRKSKSMRGLGMADISNGSINIFDHGSTRNRSSPDTTSDTPDPRKETRRRSNSASRRLRSDPDGNSSAVEKKKNLNMSNHSNDDHSKKSGHSNISNRSTKSSHARRTKSSAQLGMSDHSNRRRGSDHSRGNHSNRRTKAMDNSSSDQRRRSNSELKLHEQGNKSSRSRSKFGLGLHEGSKSTRARSRSKSCRSSLREANDNAKSTRARSCSKSGRRVPVGGAVGVAVGDPAGAGRLVGDPLRLPVRLPVGLAVGVPVEDALGVTGSSPVGMRPLVGDLMGPNSTRARSRSRSGRNSLRSSLQEADDEPSKRTRSRSRSGRNSLRSSLQEANDEPSKPTRSRSKSGVRENEAGSKTPPRSRSKSSRGSLRKLHKSVADCSIHLDPALTSVSRLSAGTARPSRGQVKLPSDGTGPSRRRSKSATRIVEEEPPAMANDALPRRSSAESYLSAKAKNNTNFQKRDRETQENYNYSVPKEGERTGQKQRSKSGKDLKELRSQVGLTHVRRPQGPPQPQGRKASIDSSYSGSISSITVSSRFHHDDFSIASDQRSHLRRAFSSPKLFFDGPYRSSFPEEDESAIEDLPAGGDPRISRWASHPPERKTSAPTIPEHDLSSAGTSVEPLLSRHTSDGGRWSKSKADSFHMRQNWEPDSIPVRPSKEMSAHSRSLAAYGLHVPDTPSHSVQTGIISELTPATLVDGSVAGGSRAGPTKLGRAGARSEDNPDFGSWMSSLHSLLLQDDESGRHHGNPQPTKSAKCDSLPRMARRHSFDSVSYNGENSINNMSYSDSPRSRTVRSVKSGFTSVMKLDGENDHCPQMPSRRDSTGSSVLYYAPPSNSD